MKKFFLFLALFSLACFIIVLSCNLIGGSFCSAIRPIYVYVGAGAIHLTLFSIALFFLWKKDLKTTLVAIGFPGKLKTTLIYSVIGLISVFAVLIILSLLAVYLGFNDQTKVSEKISGLPLVILAFAVFFAPISEELFFRAFLSPRVGIIFSSVIFGALHFSYGSIIEIVGVFVVGLLLGFIFEKSKSITPCIIVHLTYNLISISAMLLLGGKI